MTNLHILIHVRMYLPDSKGSRRILHALCLLAKCLVQVHCGCLHIFGMSLWTIVNPMDYTVSKSAIEYRCLEDCIFDCLDY